MRFFCFRIKLQLGFLIHTFSLDAWAVDLVYLWAGSKFALRFIRWRRYSICSGGKGVWCARSRLLAMRLGGGVRKRVRLIRIVELDLSRFFFADSCFLNFGHPELRWRCKFCCYKFPPLCRLFTSFRCCIWMKAKVVDLPRKNPGYACHRIAQFLNPEIKISTSILAPFLDEKI